MTNMNKSAAIMAAVLAIDVTILPGCIKRGDPLNELGFELPEARPGERAYQRTMTPKEFNREYLGSWLGDGVEPTTETRQQRRRKKRLDRKKVTA